MRRDQVTNMQSMIKPLRMYSLVIATAALVACGDAGIDSAAENAEVALNKNAPSVTFTPEKGLINVDGKPMAPVRIAYRIIGKPVVGQPVSVDVSVTSSLGPQPITVGYRINDATAMQLAASQPEFVTVAQKVGNEPDLQQVTVVPLREGRLYLNVSATIETENGSMGTVTAIPIQVGEGGRTLTENGALDTDENGEAIRSLPAQED